MYADENLAVMSAGFIMAQDAALIWKGARKNGLLKNFLKDVEWGALDVLFILHADHEQNCSATAARTVGSSESDPYCSLSAATAALYGPLHGGAGPLRASRLTEMSARAGTMLPLGPDAIGAFFLLSAFS